MNKVAPKNKFRSESQWVKRGKLWKTGDSAFVTLFLGWRKRDPKSKDVGDLQLGENKVTAWITWMLMLIFLPCSFGTFCLRSERMTWDALQGTYAFADRDQTSVLFASFAALFWTSSHNISSYQWTIHPANQLRFGSYFHRGRLDVFFDLLGFHSTLGGRLYEPVLTFCIRSQSILCKQLTRLHLIYLVFFPNVFVFFPSKTHGVEVGEIFRRSASEKEPIHPSFGIRPDRDETNYRPGEETLLGEQQRWSGRCFFLLLVLGVGGWNRCKGFF